MGIDGEDKQGFPQAHGEVAFYESLIADVLQGGSSLLVVGGGKTLSPPDDTTAFWDEVGTDLGVTITYVSGAPSILGQSFAGFDAIAVASNGAAQPLGGLTSAENDALAARASDIADFVEGGGGLFGFSSEFPDPYGYLAAIGEFAFTQGLAYTDITPTAAGTALGLTNDLDVCCWHVEYLAFPAFFAVLAVNAQDGLPSVIRGIPSEIDVPLDVKPTSCPNPLNSSKRGTLPVAILGTSGFDVRDVDVATVRLEGIAPLRSSLSDVAGPFQPLGGKENCRNDCTLAGPDGHLDLTLKFSAQSVVAALGSFSDRECRVVRLTGSLEDGTPIVGEDVIIILKKK